jgi:hypothetical protein
MVIEIIFLILLLFASAELSRQIAQSELSLRVKQFLYLNQPYRKSLLALCSIRNWYKMLGKWFWVFIPMVVPIWLLVSTHKYVADLVDCSRCTAYWVGVGVLFLVLNVSILLSFLLAPTFIIITYVIDRLECRY